MNPTQKPRVKICCISSIQEAQLAISHGAFAIGLVSEMPSGPGVISESLIAEIAATIPPWISSFLLTSKQDPAAIIKQLRRCGTNTVQICDHFPIDGYKKIKDALSWMAIVQVIHVRGPESIEEAMAIAPHVDGILLDSGNQSLAIKELGGTGRIHDWEISRAIREAVEVPVLLAGGLNADNVVEAIRLVKPFAVDLCSGVRTNGRLDEAKLARFISRAAGV